MRDTWRETIDYKKHFNSDYIDWSHSKDFSKEFIDKLVLDVVFNLFDAYMDSRVRSKKASKWIENVMLKYFNENNNDNKDFESFWVDEEFVESKIYYFLEYLRGCVYEDGLLDGLIDIIKSNEDIIIYRAISVNQVWLDLFLNKENEEVHVGEYWSWSEDGAYPYFGDKDKKKHIVYMKCSVNKQDVDIYTTFYQNLSYSEEKEITLFPNTPLELLSITIDGEEVDLSNFKNKEIYA